VRSPYDIRHDVLLEFSRELDDAAAKYPDCVSLPDGTGGSGYRTYRDLAKLACDRAYREGRLTHLHVLEEEVWEALAEDNPEKLRAELVQVGAMALKWIEDLDRRRAIADASDGFTIPGYPDGIPSPPRSTHDVRLDIPVEQHRPDCDCIFCMPPF
jgi:hypothetical protein